MTDYVELHARSAFSFLRGAATPEELIAAGAELKMPAMALLDNDGVYGAARFHLAAKKIGIIKAHIGAEITVSSFEFRVSSSKARKQNSRFQIPDSRFRRLFPFRDRCLCLASFRHRPLGVALHRLDEFRAAESNR
jgi:DNA polymerase III alpha subunit (gram-positive type)